MMWRGRPLGPIAISLLSSLFAFGSIGCDLFATRPPEDPINSGSSFEPATSPGIVLKNLQSALNFANAQDYRKCFSDTGTGLEPFTFEPSVEGLAAAPGRFATWGVREEEEYLRNIFAELQDDATATVSFSPAEITEVPLGDSIRFEAEYVVSFPHTRQSAEREAAGSLVFTLKMSARNEWYITHWKDIGRSGSPSWSLIKARFID